MVTIEVTTRAVDTIAGMMIGVMTAATIVATMIAVMTAIAIVMTGTTDPLVLQLRSVSSTLRFRLLTAGSINSRHLFHLCNIPASRKQTGHLPAIAFRQAVRN